MLFLTFEHVTLLLLLFDVVISFEKHVNILCSIFVFYNVQDFEFFIINFEFFIVQFHLLQGQRFLFFFDEIALKV
jgi:hypothetical protein